MIDHCQSIEVSRNCAPLVMGFQPMNYAATTLHPFAEISFSFLPPSGLHNIVHRYDKLVLCKGPKSMDVADMILPLKNPSHSKSFCSGRAAKVGEFESCGVRTIRIERPGSLVELCNFKDGEKNEAMESTAFKT